MRTTAMAGVIVGIISLTGMALADHVEPASATKAAFSLVNGFLPCNSPNTNTQTSNTPACAPAVPNDFCAFGPGGSGKLTIKKIGDPTTGTEDLKLTASATGLNAACESQDLHIRLSYRYTSDDCVQGSCTTEDV